MPWQGERMEWKILAERPLGLRRVVISFLTEVSHSLPACRPRTGMHLPGHLDYHRLQPAGRHSF
jgi:hypothetical protein